MKNWVPPNLLQGIFAEYHVTTLSFSEKKQMQMRIFSPPPPQPNLQRKEISRVPCVLLIVPYQLFFICFRFRCREDFEGKLTLPQERKAKPNKTISDYNTFTQGSRDALSSHESYTCRSTISHACSTRKAWRLITPPQFLVLPIPFAPARIFCISLISSRFLPARTISTYGHSSQVPTTRRESS